MKGTAFCLLVLFFSQAFGQEADKSISPRDLYRLQQVGQPKISPDGKWILYNASQADSVKDAYTSKLYMISTDGRETVCLTEQTKSVSDYNWSPEGRYISFLVKPKGEGKENQYRQLFVLDRRGGEPVQLTKIIGEIVSYDWRKDGEEIVFVIKDPNMADTASTKVRKPYEMDRYQFKRDYEGYLDSRHSHLYLFNLKNKTLDTLTRGRYDERNAIFDPSGSKIAYVSNSTDDPDRNSNTDIFLLHLDDQRRIQQITTFKGSNSSPQFSKTGEYISFLQSVSEANFHMYDQDQLAIYHIKTGRVEILSSPLDRPIAGYQWGNNDQDIYALVEDDRKQNIYKFSVGSTQYQKFAGDRDVFSSLHINATGMMAALYSDPNTPNEIYVIESGKPRAVTHLNEPFVSKLKKIVVSGFESVSSDKTRVSGILYLPDSSAQKMPLILFIHGGPVAQDEFSFDLYRQILAGAGFAVAAVNYRGSSGRGLDYCKAINADWGNKEVKDIVGSANYLIEKGVADPDRLGIGGWSYGGILTNYTIASDNRFKAAVSGAGSSFQFSMYGTDQYVLQYEEELGPPWRSTQKWMQLSYPFFRVEQIKTPTLFMASQNDFNVPVAGAEQMYQAFKSVGIPTKLIIYPGQNHGLSVPSYILHRYQSHIDWFRKYLR